MFGLAALQQMHTQAQPEAKRVRITIEVEGKPTMVVTADQVSWDMELGIRRMGLDPMRDDYQHSGQQRVAIRAWTGCDSFESFIPLGD